MNDRVTPPMQSVQALPNGEAELALVVHLPWEDVARLGQEAGRLATQMQRPVSLDEAVSHRLRSSGLGAHAKPAQAQQQAPSVSASASVSALPSRPPGEQARQAIDRINGTA
ncbi:hypothetical protein [Streptomyces sp. SID12488]|uniref:hypothetical protein n=1 Tax=Streptomyces sp. SID12488 TaxID=2706040 RepID=UPI0013DA94C8|nr:hypothetical protein [Streptomyces sp. SID12488]NEA66681.1 hypothetical protein [Streptomyces sp. SID12488]